MQQYETWEEVIDSALLDNKYNQYVSININNIFVLIYINKK